MTRCPCGKPGYRNHKIATKAAMRAPITGRVYWCPYSGLWHMTSREESEYDRVKAEVGRTGWRKHRTPKPKRS